MKGTPPYILLLVFISLLSGKVFAGDVDSDFKNKREHSVTSNEFYIVTPILLRDKYPSKAFHDIKPSFFQRPGSRFLSSLILPGSGQFANGNWVRGSIYLLAEALSIYYIIEYQNRGNQGERSYERFADQNWSVVQYAGWLIEYHDYHKIDNPYLTQLREMLNGISPTFNTSVEWNQINLSLLRRVERNTPYFTTDELFASMFSHTLPDFGSQQYYELISKYYQYQAGWRDYDSFHNNLGHLGDMFGQRFRIDRSGNYASPFFYEGVERSFLFNDNFRKSNRYKSLLIANHFISAFDAYFTLSMKQNRLNVTPTFYPGEQIRVSLMF